MLAEYKEIPQENIMPYDEDRLLDLYDDLEEEFLEDKEDGIFHHRLINISTT